MDHLEIIKTGFCYQNMQTIKFSSISTIDFRDRESRGENIISKECDASEK